MSDVTRWLTDLGLPEYGDVFAENMIDFEVLPDLTDGDLKGIGVPLGHRKKLLRAIGALGADDPTPAGTMSPEPATPAGQQATSTDAERRQLTVMFVDLVGSTELSTELDPEDLRDLMRRYQDAVAGAITRYSGHVAKYLGDGVLAYFGWPQAYEDQTERALRSGLDAVAAVAAITRDDGATLGARTGIATGRVVIGDLVGETGRDADAVSGQTPNLAARLQGVAAPGQVVIDDATRRLVGSAFNVEDLGSHELKGIGQPVTAWRVLGERAAETRFDAVHGSGLTTFVGRENEINLLGDRWRQAKGGEGQVALLSGEAGIGKSRITQALRDLAAADNPIRLRQQCATYYTRTPLYPLIHQFEFAGRIAPDDAADVKLDKIEALLALSTDQVAEVTPLVAALLSVPTGDRYPPLDLSPQEQMQKTLNAMIDQIIGLAGRQPVLMIFEDVHWADPTTLDALEMLIDRAQSASILLVITFRPEFVSPWQGHSHITSLTLNRLAREQCEAIIHSVAGGKSLPVQVRDQIVAKTDGVALFVEELTKTVLESDLVRDAGDRYELARSLSELAIPTTLQDSLMARLDRLAPIKEVAQMGAAIGRDFSQRLLQAVSPLPAGALDDALAQLVSAEFIFRRGTPPDTTYTFKHALVRDAAYESLLKSRRHALHQSIATTLEDRFPEIADTEPEVLAHHFSEAGLIEPAVAYWCRAGERASERSATASAIGHLTRGLDLAASLPPSAERDRLELDLRIAYSPVVMAAQRYGSEAAEESFERARELSESLDDTDSHFMATCGLWQMNLLRGHIDTSKEISDALWATIKRSNDSGKLVQAHHSCWSSDIYAGDPRSCLKHAIEGFGLYDRDEHRRHKFLFGTHDPAVCSLNHQGLSNVILGCSDQARGLINNAVGFARDLGHPTSMVLSLFFGSMGHHFRRDADAAIDLATEGIALCNEFKIPGWGAGMQAILGWAGSEQGSGSNVVTELTAGMERWRAAGNMVFWPWFLALQAEAEGKAGRIDHGLSIVSDALALGERTGEHWVDAELLRIRGNILMSQARDNVDDAEAVLLSAVDIARNQGAKLLELRAATSLGRVWFDQGKREDAASMLSPIYSAFTEGLGSPDLKDARELLDAAG